MQHIFISKGGQGTIYLVKCFKRAGYSVGHRPDTIFKKYEEIPFYTNRVKVQVIKSLDEFPSSRVNKPFYKKSGYGFEIDNKKSINDNLLDYINPPDSSKKVVLFNNIYKFGFFSSNNINNVIALIRHPLHGYMSEIKPERHGKKCKELGGANSKMSIYYFALSWNAIIDEIMKSSKVVIRYEFFHEDAKKAGLDVSIFKGWDSSKRNKNRLTKKKTDYFYDQVKDNYFKIYDRWEI